MPFPRGGYKAGARHLEPHETEEDGENDEGDKEGDPVDGRPVGFKPQAGHQEDERRRRG
jgi:hypothetical protein